MSGQGIKVGDIVVVKVGGSYTEMKVSQLCGDSAVLREVIKRHNLGHHMIVPCEMLLLRRFPLGAAAKVVMVGGKRGEDYKLDNKADLPTAKRRAVNED